MRKKTNSPAKVEEFGWQHAPRQQQAGISQDIDQRKEASKKDQNQILRKWAKETVNRSIEELGREFDMLQKDMKVREKEYEKQREIDENEKKHTPNINRSAIGIC